MTVLGRLTTEEPDFVTELQWPFPIVQHFKLRNAEGLMMKSLNPLEAKQEYSQGKERLLCVITAAKTKQFGSEQNLKRGWGKNPMSCFNYSKNMGRTEGQRYDLTCISAVVGRLENSNWQWKENNQRAIQIKDYYNLNLTGAGDIYYLERTRNQYCAKNKLC